MARLAGFAACVASLAVGRTAGFNDAPIIGVLTTPADAECATVEATRRQESAAADGVSCFHAMYVQWIESAGGRVVPLLYNEDPARLDALVASLNGILFTGGSTDLTSLSSLYMRTAGRLLSHVVAASEAGEHVPLWGTCLGMQTLSLLVSKDPAVLQTYAFDSEWLMLPLELASPGMATASRVMRSLPQDVRDWVTTENITVNLHHDGVDPDTFRSNQRLGAFFRVVSTNRDRRGKPFVSTIEGQRAPVYGVQWHPERPQFEFRPPGANGPMVHTPHAIRAMQSFAEFFVEEARRNNRHFPTPLDEAKHLIYNFNPAGPMGDSYRAYRFRPPLVAEDFASSEGKTNRSLFV